MRITGVSIATLATAALALAGCGSDAQNSSLDTNNLPPVISGTPPTELSAGTPYMFQPQAVDPDGDAITFSAVNLPGWAAINSKTGLVTGTPKDADVGMSGAITIEASDGKARADLPNFQIKVNGASAPPATVNTAPTISGTPATQATVGASYTFSPVAADAEGDPLTFSITNKPGWATFTPATGTLTGTPTANDVGTTSGIVISVNDGQLSTGLAAFSITVATTAPANRAPTITGTPATTVTVGKAYNFQPTGSDPDGNTLQYSITGKPTWLTFSATTGKLSGTPTAANVGTSSRMTITVTDGTLSASLPAFTIQVNAATNLPPIITGTPLATATVGTAYSWKPTASDPEGATLTFSIANKPSWLTLNTTNGTLSGTPTAADVGTVSGIVVSVSDGNAISSLAAFAIVVTQQATGSVTLNWEAPTTNTDDSALTNLAGYRITYGRSQTTLDQSIDVTNAGLTTYVVPSLATGTWYFAMYAYSSSGAESDASNVVTKSVN